MGGVVGKCGSPRASSPETKLESKIIEAIQKRGAGGSTVKSFNTIILKFPKIDENLRKCKSTFEEFDEKSSTNFDADRNGAIDPQELKCCFHKLRIDFTGDEQINDLFEACGISEYTGMKFNDFVVVLCLVYLLKEDPRPGQGESTMLTLEATFETLVDAFVFLDKNKDGHVSKGEMVDTINETISGGRSSGRIAMKRFEEMDWDKNGMVNFKEFLFAFTHWVGIDCMDDDEKCLTGHSVLGL